MLELMRNNKRAAAYSFFLTILYFGINYSIEYATDTYYNFTNKGAWIASLENGRPVQALIFYLVEAMPVSAGAVYHISQLLAVIFLAASTFFLAAFYREYTGSEALSTFLSFITLANPLVIEFFLFEEKSLFMLTILLNLAAALLTVKRWKKNEIKGRYASALLTLFLLLISVFIYQTSVQIYVILCLPFIIIYSDDIKAFLVKNLYVAVMYGVAMGSALFVAKNILAVDRAQESIEIRHILKMPALVFSITSGKIAHIPAGMYSAWCLLLLAAVALSVIMTKGKRIRLAASYIYIWAGCCFVSFLIFAAGSASISPRTLYSYGMLFGEILFYLLYTAKKHGSINEKIVGKFPRYIAITIIAVIMVFDYISFGKVFIERYQCNEADRYYAEIIREKIHAYENETGNTVDTICFYKDEAVTWWDSGYGDSEMMARAQSCAWSRLNAINLYLDRNYSEGEPDDDLTAYFSEKNWGMYSEEQVIFRENELHLCIY